MQFEFKNYYVRYFGKVINPELKKFIEENHYKKSARSLKPRHVFGLYYEELLVGVAVYGEPCGAKVAKAHGGTKTTVLELRRFCLLNECPKNSESFFMGKTLRMLRPFRVKKIVSFSDPNRGHEGVIYRASNWNYLGTEKYRTPVLMIGEKAVSVREVYQKGSNGAYLPAAAHYQNLMKQGKAKLVYNKRKHVFTYNVK